MAVRKARRATRAPVKLQPVGIVAKPGADAALPVLNKLTSWLDTHRVRYILDREAARTLRRRGGMDSSRLVPESALVVVVGGDGTLLSIARAAARARTPILGVNLGGLGFLTEVTRQRMLAELERVLTRRFAVDERLMLDLKILRGGRIVRRGAALNDIVVSKKSTIARAVDLVVEVDGRYVTSYKADGLIVATPTGSTAYSLSAGGPILDPKLDVLILNPICPHTLTHRPLVLRDTVVIDISLRRTDDGVFLTLDGQTGHPVRAGDKVRICRSDARVRLVQAAERDYFHLLRSKLKWGERLT
jgi:NAD+ kinase